MVVTIRGTASSLEQLSGAVSITASPEQIDLHSPTRELTIGQQPLPLLGDINGNGTVDFADFLILSQNFGKDDSSVTDGDLNQDGAVSFADFLILSERFGDSV